MLIRNLTSQSLRLQVGFGMVLPPREEAAIRDEYASDSLIRRLVREGIVALTPDPWAKVDERVRRQAAPLSRFDREDPI